MTPADLNELHFVKLEDVRKLGQTFVQPDFTLLYLASALYARTEHYMDLGDWATEAVQTIQSAGGKWS